LISINEPNEGDVLLPTGCVVVSADELKASRVEFKSNLSLLNATSSSVWFLLTERGKTEDDEEVSNNFNEVVSEWLVIRFSELVVITGEVFMSAIVEVE
jgi:hypothetical protein